MVPFRLYPLSHCQRQALPYTFPHAPVSSLPFVGGVNAGHRRTEKKGKEMKNYSFTSLILIRLDERGRLKLRSKKMIL